MLLPSFQRWARNEFSASRSFLAASKRARRCSGVSTASRCSPIGQAVCLFRPTAAGAGRNVLGLWAIALPFGQGSGSVGEYSAKMLDLKVGLGGFGVGKIHDVLRAFQPVPGHQTENLAGFL